MAVPRKPNYKTYTKGEIKYDRVELSLKYLLIRRKLEKEVEAEVEEHIQYMRSKGFPGYGNRIGYGLCYTRWSIKKRILKEKFDIEWHSPSELNPHVRFD